MPHRDEDRAEVDRVVADIERGFNTKDPELSVAHFLPEAWAVDVAGVELSGRDALLAAHRAGLSGALRDQYARYEVTRVEFPAPDVAVVQKRARATTAEGEDLDLEHTMTALYVLVRRNGRWGVLAHQNTLVPR